ncbi:subtilisin family serine protease [Sinobacterium caligoides]|uniref:Subtilisin family serine protease n=1 Tax=Sinobacterium caligoides TaxID=933926 RepID=A0A3N2DPS0_9GAMM|nr:S8 family serine peptidase [Sinobacterium caligoides]ROS01793.1 subtilisin family serine protease [Sinobacterium caligoides]
MNTRKTLFAIALVSASGYYYLQHYSPQRELFPAGEATAAENNAPAVLDVAGDKAATFGGGETRANEQHGYRLTNQVAELAFLADQDVAGRRYLSTNALQSYVTQPGESVIRLKGANFVLDPEHVPNIGSGSEYIYLQLTDGLTAETRDQLATTGVVLEQFIDNNTWLIEVSNEQVQQLTLLDQVYAMGERDVKDKVSPSILERGVREASESGYVVAVEVLTADERRELEQYLLSTALVEGPENIKPLGKTALHVEVAGANFNAIANINSVAWIDNAVGEEMINNSNAAKLSNIDTVRHGLGLTGAGVRLAIWDVGEVAGHYDLIARLTVQDGGDLSEHATHVAGTMVGDGSLDARAKGMAPAATLLAYDMANDSIEMRHAAEDLKIVISNHSYGTKVGWVLDKKTGDWYFVDNQYRFGNYSTKARLWDEIVKDTGLIIVKSAGNDRDDGLTTASEKQPADGGGTGFSTISSYANAKNIITVGAVYDSGRMTKFSGWGPSNDGRIKPDVVANGVWLKSTGTDNDYTRISGTSMAAPVVSGASALLVERFRQVFDEAPKASQLKAALLHTAMDQGNPGPDYDTGWGLVDLEAAIDLVDQGRDHLFARTITNEAAENLSFVVPAQQSMFKLTMVWTDPKGAASSASNLINDLDVVLVSPSGQRFYPWVKDSNSPASAATRGINNVDNIEQVLVNNPEPGHWNAYITGAINQGDGQQVSVATSIAL